MTMLEVGRVAVALGVVIVGGIFANRNDSGSSLVCLAMAAWITIGHC